MVRFGVFSDLHYDAVPDGDERIAELIRSFTASRVDFVIELGDLCAAGNEYAKVPEAFALLGVPCHFSIGNHNSDFRRRDEALRFLGLRSGHYSALHGNVKFIFLDPNYVRSSAGVRPGCKLDISGPDDVYPFVPADQLEWLKRELADDGFYYVICSHQSLANEHTVGANRRGVANSGEIRRILEERNRRGKRVILCLNGHDHGDASSFINGICYYSLNAASYIWLPQPHACGADEAASCRRGHSHRGRIILYREPLHIIVSINDGGEVTISGMSGHYADVTPADLGMGDRWNGVSIRPETSSIRIDNARCTVKGAKDE